MLDSLEKKRSILANGGMISVSKVVVVDESMSRKEIETAYKKARADLFSLLSEMSEDHIVYSYITYNHPHKGLTTSGFMGTQFNVSATKAKTNL